MHAFNQRLSAVGEAGHWRKSTGWARGGRAGGRFARLVAGPGRARASQCMKSRPASSGPCVACTRAARAQTGAPTRRDSRLLGACDAWQLDDVPELMRCTHGCGGSCARGDGHGTGRAGPAETAAGRGAAEPPDNVSAVRTHTPPDATRTHQARRLRRARDARPGPGRRQRAAVRAPDLGRDGDPGPVPAAGPGGPPARGPDRGGAGSSGGYRLAKEAAPSACWR